jgi:hypothetical protein
MTDTDAELTALRRLIKTAFRAGQLSVGAEYSEYQWKQFALAHRLTEATVAEPVLPPSPAGASMSDVVLSTTIDLLDTLDVYLMAPWDDETRRRLRKKAAECRTLLVVEHKRRQREVARGA